MNSFVVVREFECAVAKFAGARHAIAVNTGTSALFLSMKYAADKTGTRAVTMPAHTFVSVPMAAIHAGLRVHFDDRAWSGTYTIDPLNVVDGALRFRRGMYNGGLHCLSFQARKLLNIGEGGMILTDDAEAAKWLRKACYSGRGAPDYKIEDIDTLGWQYYMTPEKAARGLHLMDYVSDDTPDQVMVYDDMRKVKVFMDHTGDYVNGIHRLANIVGTLDRGENCRIDAFVTITGKVKIGKNCHIGTGATIFGTEGVEIGDDSSISPGAQIFTTSYDKDTKHLANPMSQNKLYAAAGVVIGSRCIVGAGSVVLPGSRIADDSCIGALSLVKANHSSGLWAGIPVRRVA